MSGTGKLAGALVLIVMIVLSVSAVRVALTAATSVRAR